MFASDMWAVGIILLSWLHRGVLPGGLSVATREREIQRIEHVCGMTAPRACGYVSTTSILRVDWKLQSYVRQEFLPCLKFASNLLSADARLRYDADEAVDTAAGIMAAKVHGHDFNFSRNLTSTTTIPAATTNV